jgi:hypothetical protein
MTNSTEVVWEVIQNAKALRRYASQPDKPKKHRYERRKVHSLIRLGEWDEDESN